MLHRQQMLGGAGLQASGSGHAGAGRLCLGRPQQRAAAAKSRRNVPHVLALRQSSDTALAVLPAMGRHGLNQRAAQHSVAAGCRLRAFAQEYTKLSKVHLRQNGALKSLPLIVTAGCDWCVWFADWSHRPGAAARTQAVGTKKVLAKQLEEYDLKQASAGALMKSKDFSVWDVPGTSAAHVGHCAVKRYIRAGQPAAGQPAAGRLSAAACTPAQRGGRDARGCESVQLAAVQHEDGRYVHGRHAVAALRRNRRPNHGRHARG